MTIVDERPAVDFDNTARMLAHAIARDETPKAVELFSAIAAASPVELERAEPILRVRIGRVKKLRALFDLFDSAHPGALTRLRLVAKACEIAVAAGNPELGQALLARCLAGAPVRFGSLDALGAGLSTTLGPDFRKGLAALKYSGLQASHMDEVFALADLLGERIDLDGPLGDHLFSVRSDQSLSREMWDREWRFATAMGHIVNDRPFVFPGGSAGNNFSALVDRDALRRDFDAIDKTDGLLVVGWHAGLRPPMADMYKTVFPEGLTVQRPAGDPAKVICIQPDPGAAMIAAIRAMMDGRTVLMYPDGKHGNRPHAVSVAGRTFRAAGGAVLIAYESKCATAWYTILPDRSGRFVHQVVEGPRPERREKFNAFAQRWLEFYWGQVSAVLTGPPSRMFLGNAWGTLPMWDA